MQIYIKGLKLFFPYHIYNLANIYRDSKRTNGHFVQKIMTIQPAKLALPLPCTNIVLRSYFSYQYLHSCTQSTTPIHCCICDNSIKILMVRSYKDILDDTTLIFEN